jgi:hypothetical protein
VAVARGRRAAAHPWKAHPHAQHAGGVCESRADLRPAIHFLRSLSWGVAALHPTLLTITPSACKPENPITATRLLHTEGVQVSCRGVELAQRATPPVMSRRSRCLAAAGRSGGVSPERSFFAFVPPHRGSRSVCLRLRPSGRPIVAGGAARLCEPATGKSCGEAAALLPAGRSGGVSPERSLLPSTSEPANAPTNVLPVAFKPGRRLRPLHLASLHDSRFATHALLPPARTETAVSTPPPHDSNKIRKPSFHNAQRTTRATLHTTPVRTGAARPPICSRTRFSRPSGRTSGSGVQRHGSPVVQRVLSKVWETAYGCGRH